VSSTDNRSSRTFRYAREADDAHRCFRPMREGLAVHRLVVVGLGLLVPAIVLGCGGSSSSSTPSRALSSTAANATSTATESTSTPATAATVDVCQLFPKQDAEALVHTPLNPGEAGNPLNPSCTYNGPTSGPTAQVTIYIGDGAKKTYDLDHELGHTFTPASGVTADEAWEEDNAIFFRKGTTWVQISLVLLNDASENRAPLEQAAQKLASRL
jgi:hypothetical protein